MYNAGKVKDDLYFDLCKQASDRKSLIINAGSFLLTIRFIEIGKTF
jgi:hypothetical protein